MALDISATVGGSRENVSGVGISLYISSTNPIVYLRSTVSNPLADPGTSTGVTYGTTLSGLLTFTGLTVTYGGTHSLYAILDVGGASSYIGDLIVTQSSTVSSVKVTLSSSTSLVNTNFNAIVYLYDLYGNQLSSSSESITLSLVDFTATLSGSTSGTFTSGQITLPVQINRLGTYTIKAVVNSITAYSSTITVFSTPSSVPIDTINDQIVNSPFAISFKILDASSIELPSSYLQSITGDGGFFLSDGTANSFSEEVYYTSSGLKTVTITTTTIGIIGSATFTVSNNVAEIVMPNSIVPEGESNFQYTVQISYQIRASVTITITYESLQFTISPTSLTFTTSNYATPQTVTVQVLNTAATGQWTKVISHSISDTTILFSSCMSAVASTGAMTLTIYDSTTESILISGSPVMNEGGSATYTVKLTSAPTASVIMSISISGDMTLSSSSITITTSNWNSGVTVTVTSPFSSYNDGGLNSYAITHTVTSTSDTRYTTASIITNPLYAYVIKNDQPGVLISDGVVFQEGYTGGYSIVLATEPTDQVTVSLTSTSALITFTPSSIIFTRDDWDIPQEISLETTEDETPRGLQYSASITHSVYSADPNYNAIVPIPNDIISVSVINPCRGGMWAWPPGSGECNLCPQGYKCPTLYGDKVACTSKEYSPLGAWNCVACPPGHSCNGLNMPKPCPFGSTAAWGAGVCTTCVDQSCDLHGFGLVGVPAGMYIRGDGHSIYLCPAGYYCAGGSSSPVACSSGSYAPPGSSSCTICPSGTYCPDISTPIPLLCDAYSYSTTSEKDCHYCPIGHSCSSTSKTVCSGTGKISLEGWMECLTCDSNTCKGLTNFVFCDPGQYLDSTTCTTCTAGYECDGMYRKPCPPGTYSAAGASGCKSCAFGTYSDHVQASSCTAVSGTVSIANLPNFGSIECYRNTKPNVGKYACIPNGPESCPVGHFCSSYPLFLSSSIYDVPCPSGFYNPSTLKDKLSDCVPCTAGNFCPLGSSAVTPCPPGHYCLANSYLGDFYPCPAGTFSTATGGTDLTSCSTCPVGKWCPEGVSWQYPCPDGTYCPAGSTFLKYCVEGTTSSAGSDDISDCTASTCVAGKYCTPGSAALDCPIGTFNTAAGGKFVWDACTFCSAGYACKQVSQSSSTTTPCDAGYFCPVSTEFARQFPCPAGTYSDLTYLTTASSCTTCTAGSFCVAGSTSTIMQTCPRGAYCTPGNKYSHQDLCPAGTYLWTLGNDASTDCVACPVGRYCQRGANWISGYCAQGYFCPASSTFPDDNDNKCGAGTYNPLFNSSSITECLTTPGGYFSWAAMALPIACPEGTFKTTGGTQPSDCGACTAGKYCPKGTATPIDCAAGYYSSAGAAACSICPAGTYCTGGTSNTALGNCPAGKWCPIGTSQNPTSLTAYNCPIGFYCVAGATTPVECPAGKYGASSGLAASSACTDSAAGKYTIMAAFADTGLCDPGFYCVATSNGPWATPCAAGTFRSTPGATASSDCSACTAGYYCPLGSIYPTVCPVGYYCLASVATPTYCPIGTIGLTSGLSTLAGCSSCPEGSYCSTPGLLVPDGFCTQGYLCSAGSSSSTPSGTICTAGGYCEPGFPTKRNCPPGSFNSLTGAKDVSWCKPCTAGYFCLGSESTITANTCLAGYYCPIGSYWGKQQIAGPGTYTTAGQSTTSQCQPPKYNPVYAQSSCIDCPAGFYCNAQGMSSPVVCPIGSYCIADVNYFTSCAVGTFNPRLAVTSQANCLYCTPGYNCPTAGLSSTPASLLCDPGYYCTFGAVSKKPGDYVVANAASGVYGLCPAGNYCPQGSPVPIPCPSGTYRFNQLGAALTDCAECTEGYYCTDIALTTTQGECDAGYYCFAEQRWPRPPIGSLPTTLQYCVAGEFCVAGSNEPVDCPAGTYQDLDYQSTCITCPEGYFCPDKTGDYSVNICPLGHYCPEGTQFSNQYPCPSGTYSPAQGLIEDTQCLQCTPGNYCQNLGQSAVSGLCDAGYFCKIGSKSINPQISYPGDSNGGKCLPGYYCPQGSAMALECDGGSYCATTALAAPTGLCNAGYYCIGKATIANPTDGTTGNICPAGFYCPSGSISPIACPKGTYLGSTGNDQLSDCVDCPAGQYCGNSALTTPTGSCAAGYFCPGSNYEYRPLASKCIVGYYCPTGSPDKIVCPTGYYQDQTLQSSCKVCPQGYYCPNSAMTAPTRCDPGYYCPQGTINKLECGAGTYNALFGRWLITQCLACPPGKYCDGTANSTPDGDCLSGYYCTGGAIQSDPDNDAQGGKCPKGNFCPTGSVAPTKCTPGSYCQIAALTAVTGQCSAGFYCLEGASSPTPRDRVTGAVCPTGYYCPIGSQMPTPCDPGYYQSAQGKSAVSDCIICPAGFYCADRASPSISGICSAGYYCPVGQITPTPVAYICDIAFFCPANSGTQNPCVLGTYQNQIGQSSCKTCPAGFYCDMNESTPHLCPIGYMCPAGSSSTSKIACGDGQYQPFQGQSSCLTCPMGYKCGTGPVTVPTICPIYSYCVEGTNDPAPFCPSGKYTDKTGLQSKDECMPCPVGKYCTNGRVQADCEPGYYCISGVNTPTPDSYTNSGYGQPCPEGYYCEIGTTLPTPCPSGKFRTATTGKTASDCSDCQAGYYCIMNDPVPKVCPSGHYCPAGSDTPIPCPAGHYALYKQSVSSDVCTICPEGYLCSQMGTADYKNYPCTPGYYCSEGTLILTESPEGYYSPGYNAGSEEDLKECPPGYYCEEKSTGYEFCLTGTYCPKGTSTPQNCTAGNFCEYVSASPTKCPTGWYCPLYSSDLTELPPLNCPERTLCPAGTKTPGSCSAGYIVTTATTVINPVIPSCDSCPPGKYSTDQTSKCFDCNAGYMCLGKTPTPTPVELDTGYQCDRGYYCPVGALKQYRCPEGTYSNETTLTSLSACINCPINQYNDMPAQTECKKCGIYATSAEGATGCSCRASNRVYLQNSGHCICQNGYEFIDSSGNDRSSEDGLGECSQKVYTRCNLGEVRDELGSCRSTTDCNSECNGGKGTRSPSSGLCQCEEVDDVNQACNLNCRTESQTMTFNELGQFEIYDPTTGLKEKIDKSDIQGIKGSPACYPNKSCKVHSVEMTADVGIKGLFGVTSAVKSSNARRIQDDTSKYIKNPVICLNIGETMAFSVIAPNHYPVYMKDSLLNSNPNFDYSEFDDLKTEMQTNSNTTLFVFSFNQGGVYLFADAADKSQQLVVGVMSDSSECPYTDSQIQPRTASAIHLIGTNLKTDIILDVNWEVVIGLMISLVVAVLIFTALFYYYSKLAWKMSPSERVPYRELNKHLHIEGDEGTRTTMQLVIDGKEPGSSSSDAEEVREMIFEKVPEVAAYEPTTYLDENNQVDSGLVQAIKEKIRNNNKQVMKFLEDSAADSQQRMQKLAEETEELRNLLYDLLDPLNQLVGKPSKKLLKDISGHEDSIMGSVQPTLIPDLDYQEALDEIAENSGLIDQDKNKLMNELNSELQKLEDNIKSDKSKQDEELQRRLALRAKRRKELEKEKHEIEKQEKALTKTHLNELWEANMKLEEEEKQIQVDFNSEKEEIRRNVLGEQVVDLQQKLQASIKAHPDRSQEFLRQYEQHVEALENNLTMNQMRQHQELVKRLEEKRTQRKAALRDRQAQVESEIRSKQQAEKQDLERKKHDLEIEEAVAEALPITTVEVSDKSLKNLEKRHKDELQNYEKELKSLENKEVSSLQKQATIKESKLTQQKADLERQKKKLVEMVSNASEDERESLLRDLADTEMRLKDTADKASQEQKKNLDERLELRRKMRDEKLKALKQKQDEEKRNLEAQAKVKLTEDKAQQLDQAIQTALAKLPADKQNEAIKALLEEKHEHERDKLQRKLRKKLRDRQKDTIREIMRMKASDLEVLRNEFKDKIKAAGRDSEALAQIQHDESEALNRIDYHYMKQLEKAQEDAWRDQQQKNQKELLALIDQQLAEMRKHLRQQGADSSGNKELEEDLKKERQRVEEEGKRKLYDLSKKKEELEALRQQKQKELEDMLLKEKQREEMENRRQLLLDKKRALMEKQKKIREDLLKRGQLTNEQMEKLISEHQRELSALENAIARERDRQMALMTQKLAEKMQKKNEYEFTVQKMKEEQSRWQKEMEELPGITNKQATTLLLKWRRYPKRGIKDIEKAIKTVDPMERSFPVPVALEDVTTTDGSDPRLEELVSRVDRIEKIVKNVDTSQFGNAVKALEELEKAMKNLKA